jgi:hypothetical protein
LKGRGLKIVKELFDGIASMSRIWRENGFVFNGKKSEIVAEEKTEGLAECKLEGIALRRSDNFAYLAVVFNSKGIDERTDGPDGKQGTTKAGDTMREARECGRCTEGRTTYTHAQSWIETDMDEKMRNGEMERWR